MNNQKKIEEILYSIQELILEAKNEEKLDLLQTTEIIELNKINQSKAENLENNYDYKKKTHVNKVIKTKHLEVDTTKNNSYLTSSWKNLSFKKCQEKIPSSSLTNISRHSFENEIEKIFRDSLSFWVKKKSSRFN